MADKKISQLTTLAQADVAVTADFLPIVDTSATETKKATPQALVQAGATGATLPVALGAVGTPSYTFTGDLNTGMWSPAADTVAVSTGGSERLRVDSSGNVGLGVTPSASTIAQFEGGSNLILVGRGNVYSSNNATFNSGWKYISTAVAAQYNISGAEHRWFNAASGTAGNAITFTQAMTLDSSGNLGIGTANPAEKLQVNGSMRLQDTQATISLWKDGTPTKAGQLTFNTARGDAVGLGTFNGTSWSYSLFVDGNGSALAGQPSLATNATNGFLYVPTCAGTPTGTPTAITGMAPIVVDTTNNKLYFYSGGAWLDAGP